MLLGGKGKGGGRGGREAPAINRPWDNEVRGVVGWSEVTMTMTIQITITRTIKITITIEITIEITIPIRITIIVIVIIIIDRQHDWLNKLGTLVFLGAGKGWGGGKEGI